MRTSILLVMIIALNSSACFIIQEMKGPVIQKDRIDIKVMQIPQRVYNGSSVEWSITVTNADTLECSFSHVEFVGSAYPQRWRETIVAGPYVFSLERTEQLTVVKGRFSSTLSGQHVMKATAWRWEKGKKIDTGSWKHFYVRRKL